MSPQLYRPRAFTLIELVVVILIVAILAAVVTPRFVDLSTEAQAAAVVANVRVVHAAADLYQAGNGKLPADALRGKFPGGFAGLVPAGLFTTVLAEGALYDWNGPGGSSSDYGLTVVYPNGHNAAAKRLYTEIEAIADDGSSKTGWITTDGPRIKFSVN